MENLSIYQSPGVYFNNKSGHVPKTETDSRYFFKAESFACPKERVLQNEQLSGLSPYYEIIWILKGSASVKMGSHTYGISEQLMCSLFAGQRYTLQPVGVVKGYRISFSQEFLFMTGTKTSALLLEIVHQSNNLVYRLNVNEDLRLKMQEILSTMVKECAGNLTFRSEILKGLLRIFLIYFKRLSQEGRPTQMPGNDSAIFMRFKNLVKENFTTKKTVAEYARDLHITQNYLNEIIKKVSGDTASSHIQQQILSEAKQLALHHNLSMKQISYQLGFLDTAHFSKFFRNKTGMNFTDFKKGIVAC